MTEVEKMEAGLEYRFTDRELGGRRRRAIATVERYNAIDSLDFAEQERFVAEELFGSAGVGASVQQGFNCDNGRNIHVGDHLIINYGCTILDVAEVTMGDWVMIGPHVLISTVNHPLSPRGRRNRLGVAKPVHIGDDVWIGGHATILPGVTIGDGAVVAAGAVVHEGRPALHGGGRRPRARHQKDRGRPGRLGGRRAAHVADILREAPRIGGGPRRAADLHYSALRVGQ